MTVRYDLHTLERELKNPGETLHFAKYADALLNQNQALKAAEVAQKGVELFPGYLTGHLVFARCLRALGNREGAAEQYHAAVALDERCPSALKGLAEIESGEGRAGEETFGENDEVKNSGLETPTQSDNEEEQNLEWVDNPSAVQEDLPPEDEKSSSGETSIEANLEKDTMDPEQETSNSGEEPLVEAPAQENDHETDGEITGELNDLNGTGDGEPDISTVAEPETSTAEDTSEAEELTPPPADQIPVPDPEDKNEMDKPGTKDEEIHARSYRIKQSRAATTATLAEIYFKQGVKKKAIEIYQKLLDSDPENGEVASRIEEIKASAAADEAQHQESAHSTLDGPVPGIKIKKRKR